MLQIVIPARLESSRLPEKMLQRIGGKSLIQHAVDRVIAGAGTFPVLVATDDVRIAREISNRCEVILTSWECRSGTDRVAEAMDIIDRDADGIVVNVQADMPFLNPGHLRRFLEVADKGGYWDVLTAIVDQRVVRVRLDAFERAAVPCHVGIYAYKRVALRCFAALPTAPSEAELRLEQMRAVEAAFAFGFHAFPEMPFEVNTPQDLAAAQWMAECVAA